MILFRKVVPQDTYRDSKGYPEPSLKSKMELFAKIVNVFHQLNIFAKRSILDIRLGF